MKTIWGGNNSITVPNTFFCTKSRYAYVKVALEEPVRNQDVTLEVYDVANEDASKITIARKTDDRGVAIFPIGAVCESLVKEYGEGIVVMFNASYPGGGVGYSSRPIVGYADYEIKALNVEAKGDTNATNYPAAKKIVIYPYGMFRQTVFVPASNSVTLSDPERQLTFAQEIGPYIEFDPVSVEDLDYTPTALMASILYDAGDEMSISIPVKIDLCTNGVFLKWIDKSGIPYVYRWTPEMTADEMSVDSTYTQLDETLQPFEVQNKTMTKRYTLHSRIVERDIYEMCKTIIGSQAVWMWDTTLSDWVRCSMEDSEAEDSGAPMQDLVIEVVKREYNL